MTGTLCVLEDGPRSLREVVRFRMSLMPLECSRAAFTTTSTSTYGGVCYFDPHRFFSAIRHLYGIPISRRVDGDESTPWASTEACIPIQPDQELASTDAWHQCRRQFIRVLPRRLLNRPIGAYCQSCKSGICLNRSVDVKRVEVDHPGGRSP